MIRHAQPTDAEAVCRIYNHYIADTIITFEETPIDAGEILRRMETVRKSYPWLVYEENGSIIGYSYATLWKSRSAFRHSVESTVYLDHTTTGKGIGSQLYHALIGELKQRDVHCIVGGIALPNDASVALHEKFGFEKVAHFKEVGWKFEKWIDVGYWEKILVPNR